MSRLQALARGTGWLCAGIGAAQMLAGSRSEPGMQTVDATVDSHVRFMGAMFVGYGLGWVDAADREDITHIRVLAAVMAAGGASRLLTRVMKGRPHPAHDALMGLELSAPLIVEAVKRTK